MKTNTKTKIIGLFILLLTLVIFIIITWIKSDDKYTKRSHLEDLQVLNYVPKNTEFSIITNANNMTIKKFIKTKLSKDNQDKVFRFRDGFISFLGLDLQTKIEDLYDGELSLSAFKSNNQLNDILLIFKIKK